MNTKFDSDTALGQWAADGLAQCYVSWCEASYGHTEQPLRARGVRHHHPNRRVHTVSCHDAISTPIPEVEPAVDRREQYRLERRMRRMTVTLEWLHQYADDRRTEPVVHTKYIRQAIVDFESEIEAMNARLRDVALGGA